jgi:glucans biosynthesis protein C
MNAQTAVQAASVEDRGTAASRRERLLSIDNLRWTMILLVISMHSADTYSPLGSWYYTDRRPLSHASLLAFAAWQMYLQSFFMGLLFFVAGFFVPASLQRKGPQRFLRDRAYRLGLPVLFYMFLLGPVTEYFFSHSWNSTEPTSFAHEWIKHIRNGQFLQENGPLWFCLALLIFSAIYAGWRASRGNAQPFRLKADSLNAGRLAAFALILAVLTFFTRAVLPPGTSLLNMHLGDFPQYILLFSAGIVISRTRWLQNLSYRSGVCSLVAALTVGLAAWFLILLFGGAFTGNGKAFSGGWHWQNAAFAFWEATSCTATSYGLLAIFVRKFNSQGKLARFLSDNAFSVYVFHPPIVIACARLLHPMAWPSLLMFVILTVLSAVVSFVLSATLFRRIPLLRNIL